MAGTWGDLSNARSKARRQSYGPAVSAIKGLKPSVNQPYVPGQPNTVASPAKGSGGLPLDPTYDATIGGLQHKRDDTLSQLSASRPQVLADYGYTASGYDSSGAPLGLQFDPNNPFSRAALAKRTYDQTQSGTQNSMAAHGQLYSGAREQAVAGNESRYQQGTDALLKALTGQLVGISQRETAAKTDYELGAGQADADSVDRALRTPPTPPSSAHAAAAKSPAAKTPAKRAKAPSASVGKALAKAGAKQRKKYS